MKLAMVFPGQGSQCVGMLKEYAGLPGIDAVRQEAEKVLGKEFSNLLDEGPAEKLNQTVNTQPAMVTGGYSAYRAWRALGGPPPEMVAGHSLGEYTALVAAGALTFRDCLPLVRFRAHLDDDKVREACAAAGGAVQAVNFNAPGQVVIAGEKAAVERAIEGCKARGAKRALPLPVSAPFHSSLMRPAGERLRPFLESVSFSIPRTSLINNVDVKIENDPARIKDALVRQAYSPVRWAETIRRMIESGVTHVVECGPGKVLAGLTKRIDARVSSLSLSDRASLEQALQVIKGS